ncbi:phosphohistidine phosphatase [Rhizobium ruizarguesonis]|uniref:phosphohistidine phosphatase n=1 Tax=Rhizobium ruizarguesonis TaxID=2081791 RepID=UPI0010305701|nr:phosphohistidine phosphatase [Rhizobium ruizarguesonis]TBA59228.1 phosphohistidine phosphatase [Rhizobium ruizarguesonis]
MNDIIAKVSSYDIFTNLIPGAALVEFLSRSGIYEVDREKLLANLVIYYLVGLVISRFGAVVLEPFLKFLRIIRHDSYSDFIEASAKDLKILTLLESTNLFRSLFTACLLALLTLWLPIDGTSKPAHAGTLTWILGTLAFLFLLSYRKQNEFIRRRVRHARAAK